MKLVSYILLTVLSIFLLLPLVFTAWGSFIDIRGVMHLPPKLTAFWTLENYKIVFQNINYRWPINTLILTIMVVSGSVFISVFTGYGLTLFSRRWIRMIIISTVIIPRYALVIPLIIEMRMLGLLNTLLACALPLLVTPLHILLAEAYFNRYPRSLIDAGKVEGLGDLGVFFRLILPNAKALIACLATLKTVEAWGDFLWQYLVLQNPNKRTLYVGLIAFVQTRGGIEGGMQINPIGISLATSIVILIPFLVVFAIGSKYFMYELKGVD